MPRPTSFRLPPELLERLERESRATGETMTALVTSMLDEGLKTRRFPGIVYRDGPSGRRAALVGGPDVWEVVRDLRHAPGRGAARIDNVSHESALSPTSVRLAADFYAEFPDEVDPQIDADVQAADRARRVIEQRERLLSS